jgi:hypothetical protein
MKTRELSSKRWRRACRERRRLLWVEEMRYAPRYARRTPVTQSLVSGKGTDPFIMEAHGAKTPWSDSQVVREELEKLVAELSKKL